MIVRISLAALTLLAIAAGALRFWGLDRSPLGFYRDEAAIAAQIICVRQTGFDSHGESLPLFSEVLGGGFVTPVYLYSGVVWTSIFGDSIPAFRSLAAAFSAAALLGLFFLGRQFFNDSRAGLIAASAAAISPWSFHFSRISWDPPAAVCFLLWGVYAFLYSKTWRGHALSGTLLSLAMYAYPPTRLHVVLLAPVLAFAKWKIEGKLSLESIAISATAALLAGIPLIQATLSGQIQSRFDFISIFNSDYLASNGGNSLSNIVRIFAEQFLRHLSPDFLLLKGDENLRHGTRMNGLFGAIEIIALFLLPFFAFSWKRLTPELRKRTGIALSLGVLGILLAFVPSALTWDSIPHALRSIGAWPFSALAASAVLYALVSRWSWLWPGISVAAVFGFALYAINTFQRWPATSFLWFDAPILKQAQEARTGSDWARFMESQLDHEGLARAYYFMTLGRQPCIPWRDPSLPRE